jgi:DNA-directed RNA polymerase specialized sigma24 family protein
MSPSTRIAVAFELREIQQQDTKAICTAMNVSVSNPGALLHRARLYLRRCIELMWLGKPKTRN